METGGSASSSENDNRKLRNTLGKQSGGFRTLKEGDN